MIADKNRIYDGWVSLEGGVDAGRAPTLIDPNQVVSAENMTFRGGRPRPRPGFRKLSEIFTNPKHGFGDNSLEIPRGEDVAKRFQAWYAYKNEVFQTICDYSPHRGEDCLMALIGGRLFKIVPEINSARVTEVTVHDPASPYLSAPPPPAPPPNPDDYPPPNNDNRLNATLIAGASGFRNGTCVGATVEPSEPPGLNPLRSTVWYKWFGVTDGVRQFFSVNQSGYMIEAFYNDGVELDILTLVGSAISPTQCSFNQVTTPGGLYFIRVRPAATGAKAAPFTLKWNAVGPVPPETPVRVAYRNNQYSPIAYMVQADKYLIAQDGISKAIIYDGKMARRSNLEGDREQTEIPTGTMMAYGMGRLCVIVNERDVAFGDLYGSHLDKQTDPSDSIVLFTERNFLSGGFDAAIPFQMGVATGIEFFPQLDTSTGNGQLLVFAERGASSFNMAIDRSLWQTSLFQILALRTTGMRGHRSVAVVNEDLWFRSDDGFRNYRQARSEASGYAHIPVSTNVGQFLDADDGELLRFASTIYFDNRVIATCSPVPCTRQEFFERPAPRGRIYHQGLAVADFDILSSFGTQVVKPAWDGHWTIGAGFTSSLPHIKIAQLVTGTFNGVTRAFAFGLLEQRDEHGGIFYQNQLYELSFDDKDDFEGAIPWEMVTRAHDFRGGQQPVTPFTENELYDGDIWISEVSQGGMAPEPDWEPLS
jgi:hypothetical protein